jgi:uncharacterized membrane protein
MNEKLLFTMNRIAEKLWFRPLIFCLLSILAALIAQVADSTRLHELVPKINTESLEALLGTISASMLVISIFAVGSMVSAFSAASNTATPRSFKLIIADDVSRNALSVFIGSFIYSIVATIALNNGYYGIAGNFTLFIFTLLFFALVILTFLRWVERISRLGRMEHTIKLVEQATENALKNRLESPTLNGIRIDSNREKGSAVYGKITGYVQQIYMSKLQEIAERLDALITINAVPGTFSAMDKPLFYILLNEKTSTEEDYNDLRKAFVIGNMRYFDDDPRFGLITLSEIASRALSPAVNDPGTAIQIISSHVRLFSLWAETVDPKKEEKEEYDRIAVPELAIGDLFEDAFRPIARDGAGNIEVMIRLQKAFNSVYAIDNSSMKIAAMYHSHESFERAEIAMELKEDLNKVKNEALFTKKS